MQAAPEEKQPKRLTTDQIAEAMRKREIPLVTNDCIRLSQPLAQVDGKMRCVRGEATEHCNQCAFYPSRTWAIPQVPQRPVGITTATTVAAENWPLEFESRFREISRDRQYNFNVPIEFLRHHTFMLHRIDQRFKVSITPREDV